MVTILALGFGLVSQFFSAGYAQADQIFDPAAADSCLAKLTVPTPIPPAIRVVQLVNCSGETVLGAANAAGSTNQPLTPVFPREGTWVMKPFGSPNNGNVLTIDIPPAWAANVEKGSIAPNIWVRTGCRYDVTTDKAQCETGGAGGVYDTSKAKLGPPGGTTITEWTFYQKSTAKSGATYYKDNFDISAVNGVSLTVDIQSVGGDSEDPGDPNNPFWLAKNYPLSVHGQDLRSANRCPEAFQLKRSQLTSGIYGFVIVGNNGKPLGGDGTVACFSNCGKYKFPLEPARDCDISDPRCYNWKVFCAGDPSQYGAKCTTDADCPVQGSCWDNPGSPIDHTCQLRGFIAEKTCPADVCTFPYGWANPITGRPDYSTQPPFGQCSDVDPNAPDSFCIGEDTVHNVFPHAYTWPNDPQTYADDAPVYRVVFAPGGTNVPITPSVGALPLCSGLPSGYSYAQAKTNCSIDIKNGAVFAIARRSDPWSCNLGNGAGNDGVICRWNAAPTGLPPSFSGVPGKRNCKRQSKSDLVDYYGNLRVAARLLGFSNRTELKTAIDAFCQG